MEGRMTELSVVRPHDSEEKDAYERLLGDAMQGDAALFARQDSVEAAWRIVDPLLNLTTVPDEYAPGSWGPIAADRLTQSVGGWNSPP